MKPTDALQTPISCDLSAVSLEDGLVAVGCFPLCILHIHKSHLAIAQRLVRALTPAEGEAAIYPRVNIIIEPDYAMHEWSVEYNEKFYWSPGV